jgi:hypothetical protein
MGLGFSPCTSIPAQLAVLNPGLAAVDAVADDAGDDDLAAALAELNVLAARMGLAPAAQACSSGLSMTEATSALEQEVCGWGAGGVRLGSRR